MTATWLTLREAAERARVHPATLRREARAGRLRHARVAGRKLLRFRPEWIDGWLTGRAEPAEQAR
jgi:excisionase family DNA binding protein